MESRRSGGGGVVVEEEGDFEAQVSKFACRSLAKPLPSPAGDSDPAAPGCGEAGRRFSLHVKAKKVSGSSTEYLQTTKLGRAVAVATLSICSSAWRITVLSSPRLRPKPGASTHASMEMLESTRNHNLTASNNPAQSPGFPCANYDGGAAAGAPFCGVGGMKRGI